MHAPSTPGHDWHASPPGETRTPPNPWLDHLGRGSWLRAHISTFAIGSVILLSLNLLRGSGGVWADTAIGAWATLIVAHGIAMVIARLLQELLADDGDEAIRPASEMRWHTPSTWTLPPRARDGSPQPAATPAPAPAEDPRMDAEAAAAAARDRRRRAEAADAPSPAPDPTERVSWKAATDAAWLASTDEEESKKKKDNDEDDFTPLKFD